MRAIEVARLQNILDRLDAGESKTLLLLWVERQVKVMGEHDFQEWYGSRSLGDLGELLYQRFNAAVLAHLSELEVQFTQQNGLTAAQYLIMEGFQPGTDFSGYNDGLLMSKQANDCLQSLSLLPQERLEEQQYKMPAW